MSFWSNPVKAVKSWGWLLKRILPPEVYAWLCKVLSAEAVVIAALVAARKDELLSGKITILDLGKEIANTGIKLALDDILDIIRTYK